MGDRIEAGTYLMACVIAGGDITVEGIAARAPRDGRAKLGEMGARVADARRRAGADATSGSRAVDVQTLPFPGFATDFMPLAVALLASADGTAIVTENVFDNRFAFVDELVRMGADVRTEGRHAVVRGVDRLSGAPVRASTCGPAPRSCSPGLAADGETVVHDAAPRRPGLPRPRRQAPAARRRHRPRID